MATMAGGAHDMYIQVSIIHQAAGSFRMVGTGACKDSRPH